MGLDGVEFLMAVEEAFAIQIPDAIAVTLRTPRLVIDYVHGQLPDAEAGVCLTQRAFYRLRTILTTWCWVERPGLRPESRLDELLPQENRESKWAKVGEAIGTSRWTRIGWFGNPFTPRITTMREAAGYIATRMPAAIKEPAEGWTRSEISWVVDRLIHDQLGIREYALDDDFVRDLGVD